MIKTDIVKAQEKWLETGPGKTAQNPEFLSNPDNAQYLRNRLKAAFLAGAKAQEEILKHLKE